MLKPRIRALHPYWAWLVAGAMVLPLTYLTVVSLRAHSALTKAKLTMARIHLAGVLLEEYARRFGTYPTSDPLLIIPTLGQVSDPASGLLSRSLLHDALSHSGRAWPLSGHMQLARLKAVLDAASPAQALALETDDAWGRPLLVGIGADGRDWVIASGGANRALEPTLHFGASPRSKPWRDIVRADHLYLSAPAGTTWN